MNKNININDIYIGLISKEVIVANKLKHFPVQVGLFTKTEDGYKHILTNIVYPVSNNNPQGDYVIMKNVVYKFVEHNPVWASKLVNENKSELKLLDIETIERRYNNMLIEILDVKVDDETEIVENPEETPEETFEIEKHDRMR